MNLRRLPEDAGAATRVTTRMYVSPRLRTRERRGTAGGLKLHKSCRRARSDDRLSVSLVFRPDCGEKREAVEQCDPKKLDAAQRQERHPFSSDETGTVAHWQTLAGLAGWP